MFEGMTKEEVFAIGKKMSARDNKFYIIDPYELAFAYKTYTSLYNTEDKRTACPCGISYKYQISSATTEIFYDSTKKEYAFGFVQTANINITLARLVRKDAGYRKLYLDCERVSTVNGNYNTLELMLVNSPYVKTTETGGVYGSILKNFAIVSFAWSYQDILNQSGIILKPTTQYQLPRQIIEVDISKITSDFYVNFHSCDGAFKIYSMWCE